MRRFQLVPIPAMRRQQPEAAKSGLERCRQHPLITKSGGAGREESRVFEVGKETAKG